MTNPRKTVIFDLGGVLLNWQPLKLLRELLPHRVSDDATAAALGAQVFESFTPTSDWALFDRGQIEPPLLAQRIAARTGLAVADVRSVIDAIPHHLQPLPHSVALLAELAAQPAPLRPRLLFLSNMPKPYARHMQAAHGFFAHFEDGLFSGDVAVMKPETEMWLLADQRFGVAHGQTMFLDDHEGNVLAARAHGWRALQFHSAGQVRPELMRWLLS